MGFRQKAHADAIPVEEAQARILERVIAVGTDSVPLALALGRVLREDVAAPFDVPERDNSAMDGYAIVARDVAAASAESPVTLRVVEDIPAGAIARQRVESGTASRIMTGALVPDGADAVVQVEWTDGGRSQVAVQRGVRAGANIRRRGEDMRTGDVVLRSGIEIGAGEIGVLASAQKRDVLVSRRPVVSVISTGDELVAIHEARTPGKVVNSNAWAIAALVEQWGGTARVHDLVRDDRAATTNAFLAALESDFVISTGGVSAGAYDYVPDVLGEIGAVTHFSAVSMKPGKPVVFSTAGERCIFSLPGNPVSCVVAFLLFVAPALRAALGVGGDPRLPVVPVRLAEAITSKGDRRTYIRVRVEAGPDGLVAYPTGAQGSGITTSMVGANALAWIETGSSRVEAGEIAPAVLFGLPRRG